MRNLKAVLLTFLLISLPATRLAHAETPAPLPVKLDIRVEESGARKGLFEALTPEQRNLAYHLYKASRAGRTLLFLQSHRQSIGIKAMLERSLEPREIERTASVLADENSDAMSDPMSDAMKEWKAYAAMFEEYAGPYTPANRKFALTRVTVNQARRLITRNARGYDLEAREEMLKLMTDPSFEVLRVPEDPEGSDLALAGGNLYQHGITIAELKAALAAGLKVELNCLVVRDAHSPTGGLACRKLTTATLGIAGRALREVVAELQAARPFALTAMQGQEIDHLITYFTTGNVEEFRQASIAWVKDGTDSVVDFTLGFIEVYDDFLGSMGSWESYVQINDPATTRISKALAHGAQYFEDKMPYGSFKKTFPADYAPPALMAYYFQEVADMRSGGYNLPNFDDIRRDVGFKNVIRLDLPGLENDPTNRAVTEEAIRAYTTADRVERTLEDQATAWRVLVLLHEIIGHGSGTYDVTKYGEGQDPVSALGNLGSALEEQRADLAALTFAGDARLIEVGIYKNAAEATRLRNSLYDYYLVRFLMGLAKQRSFAEPHSRGEWLLVKQLMDAGVVEWAAPSGTGTPEVATQVLRVKDYDGFQAQCERLLGTLQRIKANREEAELKALFAKDSPLDAASSDWAKAVIARGMKLRFSTPKLQQPWSISQDRQSGALSLELCGNADLDGLVACLKQY